MQDATQNVILSHVGSSVTFSRIFDRGKVNIKKILK